MGSPGHKYTLLTALKREADGLKHLGAVHVIGTGACRLLGMELGEEQPSLLILAGLAGALDPSLKVGDVVVDDRQHVLADVSPWRCGTIHSSPQFVATVAEKAALFRSTGALAVEMEADLVRLWAAKRHLPLLNVRAISDAADQAIDPALLRLIDPIGRVKIGRLIQHLLKQPGSIAELRRLGRQSAVAMANLAAVVGEMCR